MPDEKILGGEGLVGGQEKLSESQPSVEGGLETLPMQETGPRIEGGLEQTEGKYNEILSKVVPQTSTTTHSDEEVSLDAKSIGNTVDEESKIQKLLDLAQTKGVAHAVKVARSLSDYYALDRMHDDMADKLYEGLLAKGLIAKE